MKYRKKPIVIDAIQYSGRNAFDVHYFTGGRSEPTKDSLGHSRWDEKKLKIPTLEGVMIVNAGDWIIKGVKGELYPCKPDIFDATYEPA